MELHIATVKTAFEHAELNCRIWDWQQRLVSANSPGPDAASGDVALPKELLVWLSKWQETLWSGLRSATTTVTVQTAAVYEIIADMFLRSKEAIWQFLLRE